MKYNDKIENLIVPKNMTILGAMKKMDSIGRKLLIVAENYRYIGLLSIGDIQRGLIKNYSFSDTISSIMRNDYIIANNDQSLYAIKQIMVQIRTEFMPVVNENQYLVNVYFWEELFGEEVNTPLYQFKLPVVIMAGGLGTRMKPLTNVLPKALIPIGDQTMLEDIFERFGNHGCDTFFVTVNYKSELIEYYIKKQNLPYNICFMKESKPMGTSGSLSLLKNRINETFFVSNCDILIEQDYSEVLNYHRENKNEITLVAALKHYPIPYGTVETGENGNLIELKEKPEMVFKINSGMYILEPHLFDEIPEDKLFHITQLIQKIKKRNGKVGIFPVSEKSWKDIGEWQEYFKYIK